MSRAMGDVVMEHVELKVRSTFQAKRLLELSDDHKNTAAANLYWAALSIIERQQWKLTEVQQALIAALTEETE